MSRAPPVNGRSLASQGRAVSTGSAIPDTSMFDNPIYHFTAAASSSADGTSPVDCPEDLTGEGPATATDDPTLRTNYQSTGKAAIEFDATADTDASADRHTIKLNNFPTSGKLSIMASFYRANTNQHGIIRFLDNSNGNADNTAMQVDNLNGYHLISSANSLKGGSPPFGQIDTMGISVNGSTDDGDVYGGGSSQVSGGNFNASMGSNKITIGANFNGGKPFQGGIFDIVICDGRESLSNYQTYHNDRTS